MRALGVLAILAMVSGCATDGLPPPGPGDCQIRAGAALTEGTTSFTGIGSVAADARGGAVTVIGECPDNLHVVTRSPTSTVCYGSETWCREAIENMPVVIPASTYRALVNGGVSE